ncbi:MAG: InlB B-repeat-containing protein [Oscillospiraceae bacterium]|nr:InlB B-repeat-containing protein [Oscillospiraceae bacterium]
MTEDRKKQHLETQARYSRSRPERRPAKPGFRPDRSEAEAAPPSPPETPKRTKKPIRLDLIALAIIALLLAGALVLILRNTAGMSRDLDSVRQTSALLDEKTAPVSCEVRYLVPKQEDIVETVPYGGTVTLHAPVELDGYTFLGWARPDGSTEDRESFSVCDDTVYTARYALTFETEKHLPYLSADEDGVVDVNADVTVREAVSTLYRLLDIDLVGSGEFLDVPEDDSCRKAAATLKDLGVLEGSFLYPDDNLTRYELLRMLCCFYPASDASLSFRDLQPDDEFYPVFRTAADRGWIEAGPDIDADPSGTVCRGELARILNRVLDRSLEQLPKASAVGMILDVPPSNPWYADVAEALIPHDYVREDGVEIWTRSEPLPRHAPGQFFAGVRMHLILPNGVPAVNTVVEGQRYNASGEMTSGDDELDRLLWAYLEETVDPGSMTQEEMLRAVYDRLWRDYSWQEGWVYALGAEGWEIPEAKRMLLNGCGNSYAYAATFYELATFLGYSPDLISGMIYGTQTEFESPDGSRVEARKGFLPHAWVEITDMGIPFIYDAERDARSDGARMMFRRSGDIRWQTGYRTWE